MKTSPLSIRSRNALVISALMLCASWSSAAIYIHVEGVDGESTDSQHQDWIDVLSIDWGFATTGSPPASAHSSVTVIKRIDKASPKLAEGICEGQVYPEVEIDLSRTVGGSGEVYSRYRLYNASVNRFASSIVGTNTPTDTFSLNYERIEWEYIRLAPEGGPPLGRHGIYLAHLLDRCFLDGDGVNSDDDSLLNNVDPDDDNDGIPDAYEDENGLIRFIDDADGDLDGDQMSNFAESVAGTAADDATSVLRMATFRRGTNNTGRLAWSSESNHVYNVSRATLPEGPYQPFRFNVPSQGPVTTVDIPLDLANRFFWIEVVQD